MIYEVKSIIFSPDSCDSNFSGKSRAKKTNEIHTKQAKITRCKVFAIFGIMRKWTFMVSTIFILYPLSPFYFLIVCSILPFLNPPLSEYTPPPQSGWSYDGIRTPLPLTINDANPTKHSPLPPGTYLPNHPTSIDATIFQNLLPPTKTFWPTRICEFVVILCPVEDDELHSLTI